MPDFKIFSADKARQMTKDAIKLDDSKLYPIMEKIRQATQKKQFCCYISGGTPDYVLEKLRNLGYATRLEKGCPDDPREHDVYEITWR